MGYIVEKDWVAHSLRCVAVAGITMGHRCGYVGIPKAHPLYGVSYSMASPALVDLLEKAKQESIGDRGVIPIFLALMSEEGLTPIPELVFNVHGSITYSGGGDYPVPSDGLWWYGFDCAHCDDAPDPKLLRRTEFGRSRLALEAKFPTHGTVRDLAFVVAECEKLAAQLAELMPKGAAEEELPMPNLGHKALR
jgi:hypothetical protein